ncbi:putative murein hydrolase (TIGR00659 family) [Dysgonomonas alginatilytica]|uniref:Putative murein hydrolase (TIGR00659 family) n=1 Tax=Dysgonomonas alginatilytica TaxID=1605892 RepID=A0A2V3PPX3_9BACT|nr:LrgB family protein [Dysgonomonas alginatilytica]PXV63188.1 putative murein hydrolase (TIGR00659 family) [Dysgonomonas alginatilytica]
MKLLIESPEFILVLIFGSYLFGQWVFKKTRVAILHPLIISIAIIILFLNITKMDYETFQRGGQFVSFLLGPSVVALGYILYQQMSYLKGNVVSILTSIFVGSVTGIVSVILLAKITGADDALVMTLEPKSVTTAIAMNISAQSGGIPSLTAVIVLFCGIFGGIIGPFVLRILGIKSSIAKGLAMGASAHSVGTVKAMEMGVIEGAISGLAIGLMGVMTALLIPFIHQIIS